MNEQGKAVYVREIIFRLYGKYFPFVFLDEDERKKHCGWSKSPKDGERFLVIHPALIYSPTFSAYMAHELGHLEEDGEMQECSYTRKEIFTFRVFRQELRADRKGAMILANAGYDPKDMLRHLKWQILRRIKKPDKYDLIGHAYALFVHLPRFVCMSFILRGVKR